MLEPVKLPHPEQEKHDVTTTPDPDDPRGASRYEGEDTAAWNLQPTPPAPPPSTYPTQYTYSTPPPYLPPPTAYTPAYPAAYPAVRPTNGVATAGGVCGIVAAAISWIPIVNVFSLVLSIVAVALGAVGWRRANTLQREAGQPIGRGMAITGVVIGAVGLTLALIFIVALGSALNDLSHTTPTTT